METSVFGKECPLDPIPLHELPDMLSKKITCPGISGFDDIILNRLEIRQPFVAVNRNEVTAHVETFDHEELNSKMDYPYIRPVQCRLILDIGTNAYCDVCRSSINSHLRKQQSRVQDSLEPKVKKRRVSDSSSTNVRLLSRGDLEERLNLAQGKKLKMMQRVAKLTARMDEDLSRKAVSLDTTAHDFIKSILQSPASEKVTSDLDEESLNRRWILH